MVIYVIWVKFGEAKSEFRKKSALKAFTIGENFGSSFCPIQFFQKLAIVSAVLSLAACLPSRNSNTELRVTYGKPSRDPSSVTLFQNDFLCTATVVGKDLLLTAGHCADSEVLKDYSVYQHFPKSGAPGPMLTKLKKFSYIRSTFTGNSQSFFTTWLFCVPR